MINKQFNLIDAIEIIDSTSKDIREFVAMQSESIGSSLNEFDRDYGVVTDWSIDPFESPMLISVSIYIKSNGLQAFVDKLYAEEISRSIDLEEILAKCDRAYKTYFDH